MNVIALNQGCSLTDLDWKVVEVARRDSPLSINPDGRLPRFLRNFFGFPIARGLANERAEAFRRFCVRAWYWDLIRIEGPAPADRRRLFHGRRLSDPRARRRLPRLHPIAARGCRMISVRCREASPFLPVPIRSARARMSPPRRGQSPQGKKGVPR